MFFLWPTLHTGDTSKPPTYILAAYNYNIKHEVMAMQMVSLTCPAKQHETRTLQCVEGVPNRRPTNACQLGSEDNQEWPIAEKGAALHEQ